MQTSFENGMLQRSELLLGTSAMLRIAEARVIIFGVGGVGSWCAESLIRSGVRHLTIVDSDRVALSNCNRQLMATSKTVGEVKVYALRERLLEINPYAEIMALQKVYDATTAASFNLDTYDYIIDAIDSLTEKAQLILHATSLSKNIMFFSSMGAALRIDPTKVRTAEFWKIKGDALARSLRNKFKKQKTFPYRKFVCVYSEELPMKNQQCFDSSELIGSDSFNTNNNLKGPIFPIDNAANDSPDWNSKKGQINGSLSHITGTFGFTLASLVIQSICLNK